MNLTLCVFSLVFLATSGANFWGRRKVHCGVSPWSDWSPPANDGRRTRTRTVVRAPSNGGNGCPDLTDIQGGSQTDPWSQDGVPTKFHNKFMTGHTHYYNFINTVGIPSRGAHTLGQAADSGGLTLLPRDLLFIIDMSGSISRGDWQTTKEKLAQLIEKLCGTIGRGSQHNRIAIVTYSSQIVLNFNFKTHWTVASVKRAIMGMRQDRQMTCTGDALNYAHQYMFEPDTGIRSATESVKEVLVLTDGHSNCGAQLSLAVRRLQVKAFVFALAIGNYQGGGQAEIESMVSRPLIDHIFSVANFTEFKNMVNTVLTYPEKCVPFELS